MLKTSAPWIVRAWPPILWQASCAEALHFSHAQTRVWTTGDAFSPGVGQTLWVGPMPNGDAGMAWDWVLLPHGVVAMADPMLVISNLRFLGTQGEVLTAAQAALQLNALVHGLPWQDEVCRHLSTEHAEAMC